MTRAFNDHYPTPDWMVQELMCFAYFSDKARHIEEPCAGETQNIARHLRWYFSDWVKIGTNDSYFTGCDRQMDATDSAYWDDLPEVDWVVTNPPFNVHLPILKHAIAKARLGVAFLLRVTADEMVMETERAEWWADNPESLIIKLPRYCFRNGKNGKPSVDSAYCQWHVWQKDGYKYHQPIVRVPHSRIANFHRKPLETVY
jgi:hypothetical protein